MKPKNKRPPATAFELDPEEQALLDSVEAGEWETVPNLPQAKLQAREASANYFSKAIPVKLEIPSADLEYFKRQAKKQALPYEDLIINILHEHALVHRS
jgi:predicted DNA binding CopG/RHH family protein